MADSRVLAGCYKSLTILPDVKEKFLGGNKLLLLIFLIKGVLIKEVLLKNELDYRLRRYKRVL